jgi:hypothetical protein
MIVTYESIPFDDGEILRYASIKELSPELSKIVSLAKKEGCLLDYKVCYEEYPLTECEDGVIIGECKISSQFLKKNLSGCRRCLLVVGTVGVEMDRLIKRYSTISPMHGLIMHAVGVERVESLMNHFVRSYKEPLRPRFSPGFGDFDIKYQRELLGLVGANKNIGVSLSDTFIMSPSKSVSAVIGIKD